MVVGEPAPVLELSVETFTDQPFTPEILAVTEVKVFTTNTEFAPDVGPRESVHAPLAGRLSNMELVKLPAVGNCVPSAQVTVDVGVGAVGSAVGVVAGVTVADAAATRRSGSMVSRTSRMLNGKMLPVRVPVVGRI